MLVSRLGALTAFVLGLMASASPATGTTPTWPPSILVVKATGGETEPFAGGCAWDPNVGQRGSVFLSVCRPGFYESKGPYQIVISRPPFMNMTVIAEDDAFLGEPTISPNGKWVAFVLFPKSGQPIVDVVHSDGTERHTLLEGDASPTWASDSQRLLARDEAGNLELIDLHGHRHLFAAGSSAAWQPHGRLVAYIGPGGRLIVSQANGSNRRVFGPAQTDTLAWSPNGKTLAYVSDQFAHGLLTWDAPTGKRKLLARYAQMRAAWSLDGSRLAVIAAPEVTSPIGLYTVARVGEKMRAVAYPGGHTFLGVDWVQNDRVVFELGS